MKQIAFVLSSFLVAILAHTDVCIASEGNLVVSKIVSSPNSGKSQVSLSNGVTISLPLERLKAIATLKTPSGSPRLLMSGADCTECDMNETIYILKPINQEGMLSGYDYPGTLKAYDTGELVQKSRMFYGHCLSTDDSIVWYTDYLGEDNKWHHLNSALRISDSASELKELKPFKLESVLKQVSKGVCSELKGIDGTTEP